MKAKDLYQQGVSKAEEKARRLRAEQNQRVLREQMAEKLHRDCVADTVMSESEQRFMKPLLDNAKATVGTARPLDISFG